MAAGFREVDLVEEIESALRRLHRINRREEMAAFDRNMFVDNQQITQLETNDWQVLFGRRGTGKTTLLNAFSEYIVGKQDSVYCIFIDLRECVPSASGVTRGPETDFELALGYFYEFIRRFAQSLLDEYTDGTDLSPLQRLIRHVRGSHKPLDDLVLDICEIAEFHPVRPQIVERTSQSASGEQSKTSTKDGYSGNASASPIEVKAGISGSGETTTEATDNSNQTINEKFVFEASRRYQPLKRKLEELLDLIEAQRLYILIDEWADLNRLNDDEVQPIFAELLRKTFGGSEKISIKIASIKGATRMNIWNRQGGLGLEVGADIFEACDLDQVYISDENSISFFRKLLFKRMCKANSALVEYSEQNDRGQPTLEPPKNFFSFFLKDEEALADIVKGSGKIPRDFVSLFCHCAHALHFAIRPEWGRGTILKEISEYSIQNKHEIVSAGDTRGDLFYRIVDLAGETGSRVFLVKRNLSEKAQSLVSDLYHSRLIHPINPSAVPISVRRDYNCYYIDYGYFLEASEYIPKKSLANGCPFDIQSPDGEVQSYVVSVEDFLGDSLRCSHADCNAVFSTTAASYQKQELCPECFRAQ